MAVQEKDFLPVGSVVTLYNDSKRKVIIGFLVSPTNSKNNVYDYLGVNFPEGSLISNDETFFNHEDIKHINYLGLIDEEEKKF